jgi:hypothetical protein
MTPCRARDSSERDSIILVEVPTLDGPQLLEIPGESHLLEYEEGGC